LVTESQVGNNGSGRVTEQVLVQFQENHSVRTVGQSASKFNDHKFGCEDTAKEVFRQVGRTLMQGILGIG